MSIRSTYFFGLAVISSLLLTSIYFQVFEGIMPCPLCTLQRISFGLLGLSFLIGGLLYSRRKVRLSVNLICVFISLLGLFLAGRQVWLQHFPPPGSTECGVSIQYMMQVLPMSEVFQKIFSGTAECTQRGWELLGLNMPEWALLWFSGFLILSACLLIDEFGWFKRK